MNIDIIPIGKDNKKTRQQLMYETKIYKEEDFKRELAKLRENNIILFNNGYYIPITQEELEKFMEKCEEQISKSQRILDLAYEKLEELGG